MLATTAFAALTCAAGGSRAGGAPTEAELTQARERFAAARKLEDAGRWAEALTALQRVAEVKTTPQVRFHIALCLENVGLWTQALDGYAHAAGEAGASAPEVVKEANEHLRKLETATPTVSLHVEGARPDDELYLDRRRLLIDDQPLPIRADPGPHTAEVRRGSAVVARELFALAPRSTLRIGLRVGTVALLPAAPDAAASSTASGEGRVQRALGWTAIGVGAASAVLTGVFIGLRAGAMSRLESACPGLSRCPSTVAPIVSEGKADAALVNVFAVLAGAGATAGVVLLVTAPAQGHGAPSAARLEIMPAVGGLVTRGSF